jgi:hypothetical protein
MALPTSWQDMQRWLTLIACMEEAEILLASGQDVRAAQRLLQQQLRDAGLTETQFESTFMTLDTDMEDAELQEYLEVCRIEIATADADAKEELQSLLVAEGFGDHSCGGDDSSGESESCCGGADSEACAAGPLGKYSREKNSRGLIGHPDKRLRAGHAGCT